MSIKKHLSKSALLNHLNYMDIKINYSSLGFDAFAFEAFSFPSDVFLDVDTFLIGVSSTILEVFSSTAFWVVAF